MVTFPRSAAVLSQPCHAGPAIPSLLARSWVQLRHTRGGVRDRKIPPWRTRNKRQPGGGGKDLNKSVWDEGDFMWRSSRRVDGERKASAVCHRHELRTLAPLGRSHPWSPCFATTNVPSLKHALISSAPRSRRSAAKVSRTRRSVPSRTHGWKRRWQVWYGGKRSGRSCQRAPLRSIHRMPLSTSRASRQGRSRPSARRGGLGSMHCMMVHGSSVRSSRRAMREVRAQPVGIDEIASGRSCISRMRPWPASPR
jgi:hypothetical protein